MQYCCNDTISSRAFESIARIPRLAKLDISYCDQSTICDRAFAALAQCATLTELSMEGCCQETISDAALGHLARCPALSNLNLSGCRQLTAHGTRLLSQSTTLSDLGICSTGLSAATTLFAARRLQRVKVMVQREDEDVNSYVSALTNAWKTQQHASGAAPRRNPITVTFVHASFSAAAAPRVLVLR
jgi:hypothetical protein